MAAPMVTEASANGAEGKKKNVKWSAEMRELLVDIYCEVSSNPKLHGSDNRRSLKTDGWREVAKVRSCHDDHVLTLSYHRSGNPLWKHDHMMVPSTS